MIRLLAVLMAVWVAGPGAAACRQALALALDVSGSVDAREYRLQLDGLAAALEDAEVREKLLAMPSAPVRLMVFEWSGPRDHHILVPWVAIEGLADVQIVAETLRQVQRRAATPGTGLGVAMAEGARHLAQQGDCWKRTLDVSGDGKSNIGPRPRDVKRDLETSGIVINALVIGADNPRLGDIRQAEIGELSSYFNAEVILGPEAFVMAALGFEDYARAMREKLLRELEGLVLSRLVLD